MIEIPFVLSLVTWPSVVGFEPKSNILSILTNPTFEFGDLGFIILITILLSTLFILDPIANILKLLSRNHFTQNHTLDRINEQDAAAKFNRFFFNMKNAFQLYKWEFNRFIERVEKKILLDRIDFYENRKTAKCEYEDYKESMLKKVGKSAKNSYPAEVRLLLNMRYIQHAIGTVSISVEMDKVVGVFYIVIVLFLFNVSMLDSSWSGNFQDNVLKPYTTILDELPFCDELCSKEIVSVTSGSNSNTYFVYFGFCFSHS